MKGQVLADERGDEVVAVVVARLHAQGERIARALTRGLQALGLHDSYRLQHEEGGQFSWWDYRAAGFRRNLGLRIDLVLVSEALRAQTVGAHIDREPRLWERPSDHTPVWLELDN